MFRSFAILCGLLVALAGCVRRMSTAMNAWVGKEEAQLVSELGAPNRTADLPNGQKVLTWVTTYNGADPGQMPVMVECVRSFTISASKVVSWSTRGCPSIITR